jgi:dienelactone hydrolase
MEYLGYCFCGSLIFLIGFCMGAHFVVKNSRKILEKAVKNALEKMDDAS